MGTSKAFVKLSSVLLASFFVASLASCGRKPPLTPEPSPTAQPVENNRDEYVAPAAPTPPPASPNSFISKFKVDNAYLSDWQARGIAVTGGSIFVSVADPVGLSKKGSILKISSDGKTIKDLASSWLGFRHPMDATVEGLTVSGSNLLAVDPAGKMYVVDSAKGTIKVVKTEGSKDVAAGGGAVFVSNGSVSRTDSSASARNPVSGLNATGGIGADKDGNVYAVSGNTIKKADSTGSSNDIISSELVSPVDVAVDDRNGDIYVLEQQEVKRFNRDGMFLIKFPSQAAKPSAITVDASGIVYIADYGTSSKDSQVIKFSASIDGNNNSASTNNFSGSNVVDNYGSPSYNNSNGQSQIQSTTKAPATASDYNSYAAPKRK